MILRQDRSTCEIIDERIHRWIGENSPNKRNEQACVRARASMHDDDDDDVSN